MKYVTGRGLYAFIAWPNILESGYNVTNQLPTPATSSSLTGGLYLSGIANQSKSFSPKVFVGLFCHSNGKEAQISGSLIAHYL